MTAAVRSSPSGQLDLIDTSLPPANDRIYHVSKAGSDVTGDGSSTNPFASLPVAMAAIPADAAPAKRYAIQVDPGTYSEAFALKANVIVVGTHDLLCRLSGAISLDSTWTPAGDNRSGFQNITFATVAQTFNMASVSANEGKLILTNCTFNARLTLTAFSNINQADIRQCRFLGGYTQTGFTTICNASLFQNGGTLVLNERVGGNTILGLYGGDADGSLSCTTTGGLVYCELGAFSLVSGPLNLTGAVTFVASPGSLPPVINLAGGATDPRPAVTGSRAGNAALTSLLSALQTAGLILNSTSA